MSREEGLVDVLNGLVDYRLLTLNTQLPAVVTSVDYENNHLDARPLVSTRYSDERQVPFPELFDVPFLIVSGNAGSARITFPIKVGDTVLIQFSQRDGQGFMQSDGRTQVKSFSGTTHGLYPILALPCLYTNRSSKATDPDNIVIENGSTSITMNPSGVVTVNTPTAIFTNDVTVRGDLTVEGATRLSSSVTSNNVNISDDHAHSGITTGGSNSGPPT